MSSPLGDDIISVERNFMFSVCQLRASLAPCLANVVARAGVSRRLLGVAIPRFLVTLVKVLS
ncbi:hypothetical protein [Bartonella sp. DGB2]|uniref:hypothetical protein n=1 Tax=Bartonella sp. DGB2 TaxID=3388426 RepID=UPI00398FEE73